MTEKPQKTRKTADVVSFAVLSQDQRLRSVQGEVASWDEGRRASGKVSGAADPRFVPAHMVA